MIISNGIILLRIKILRITAQSLPQYYGKPLNLLRQNIHTASILTMERKAREIKIPVPWGHIAGKWWGPENVKPLLCLHGYQDNAGTWDALAPLLPPEMSVLAIDFPGHGYSSHFPRGIPYSLFDFILTVHRVVNWYGWDKISLLGHSFGSTVSFIYSALYPEHVEHYIAIDAMKPLTLDLKKKLTAFVQSTDYFLKVQFLDEKNTPTYTYWEAVDYLHENMKHWASREACAILAKRGTIKLTNGCYIFSRDPQLKAFKDLGLTHEFDMSLAANVRCKVLVVIANEGLLFETLEMREKFLNVVKDSAAYYEIHTVDGLHHVHLDFPEKIAPLISNFLKTK